MMARALNLRTVVAFVGSGCSAPLGYPKWWELVQSVVDGTLEVMPGNERLNEIKQRFAEDKDIAARDLIFYLGFCQSLLGESKATKSEGIHKIIADRIEECEKTAADVRNKDLDFDPYPALLNLEIDRFITSNYDLELDKALEYRFKEKPCSFTQDSADHYRELTGFALPRMPGLRHAVFHCHGTRENWKSIVASEKDYQEWYIDPTHSAFRESFDLLFGSNPMLFVGFGMNDDDLLRHLRVLTVINRDQKSTRPLFALMPDSNAIRDHDRVDSLYDRFGIHVIPYDIREDDSAQEHGRKLCKALERLKNDWLEHAERWLDKPVIRRVEARPSLSGTYRHYAAVVDPADILAPEQTQKDVDELIGEVREKDKPHRVIVITGPGGCGKSWRVLRLLDRLEPRIERDRFSQGGIFFGAPTMPTTG